MTIPELEISLMAAVSMKNIPVTYITTLSIEPVIQGQSKIHDVADVPGSHGDSPLFSISKNFLQSIS